MDAFLKPREVAIGENALPIKDAGEVYEAVLKLYRAKTPVAIVDAAGLNVADHTVLDILSRGREAIAPVVGFVRSAVHRA
ncbi:MAG: hypothetical protein UT33_C0005G0033 [Candidatus Peregrinibacteria bacterium GW2011_GWC2_39_14]|nr:MAG: hypothetical protein US92_C0001G0033 [Candidatus Peregrinibacteria bacterium GW2011_GWA2_38_36]KKR07089.1 MAG: hypothetical protein UT33_C0005G0033 [Candidatus Peregrinibacteria bacterium GW2011_GWC2_39_14]